MAAKPPPEEVHTVKGAVIGLVFALIVLLGLGGAAAASYDPDSGDKKEDADHGDDHSEDDHGDDDHGDDEDHG